MVAPPIPRATALPAGRPVLARRLRFLERPWSWLLLGLLGIFFVAALTALALSGALADRMLRGYTAVGLLLGVLAVLLSLTTAVYSARKRWLQEQLPLGRGTMMMWLWSHVVFGSLALVAAIAHAGWGSVSLSMSTGKLLLFVFVLLVATGIVWRLIYRFVPPVAAPKVGNYARDDALRRAEEQVLEIEKLAAGRPAQFHALKDWMVANESGHRLPPAVEQALAAIPPADQASLAAIRALAASRNRALTRHALMARYTRLLQGLRVVHIPLTLAAGPLLVLHVFGALEIAPKVLPLGSAPFQALSGLHASSECKSCHGLIYAQWTSSMHAHALKSPVTLAQNNQLLKAELGSKPSPDPRQICVNCHGPVATAIASDAALPFSSLFYADELVNEGIGCATCHSFVGSPKISAAGGSAFQRDLAAGTTYVAQIADPVGNAFHRSETTTVFTREPDTLCDNCHNVLLDTNGDGTVAKGQDLVLQTTTDEYGEYRRSGGQKTCIGCHMPVVRGKNRAADTASIPFEQDEAAPPREIHDHSFVGVDYPLDAVAQRDPQRERRAELLRGGGKLELEPAGTGLVGGQIAARITITNVGAGHNLPTGFAFARQMWLELKATDASGRVLASSGVLASSTDDLCDAGTLDDDGNPMKRFVQGCTASDPQLVSFQQKLVDRIDFLKDKSNNPVRNEKGELKPIQPAGSEEAFIQHLAGGVVTRVRPIDKTPLPVLAPAESRTFTYRLPLAARAGPVTLSVRLLFRSLPPYFLRALAANQPASEKPALGPLIGNVQVVEMAAVKQTFN